jgi:hypothetical protein
MRFLYGFGICERPRFAHDAATMTGSAQSALTNAVVAGASP